MTDDRKKYFISLIIAAAIIAFVLVLDLVTKYVTDGIDETEVIPGFFYIVSHHNPAASFSSTFGIPQEIFMPLVIVLTFVACGVILFMLIYVKKKHILFTVSLAMIVAGAAGNLVDRICFGYVRDFLSFILFGNYSFAVFNIADSSLVCGVIVLMVWIIFFYMRGGDKEKPMNPALVTDGAPGNMPKKEFEPVNMPRRKPEEPDKEKDKDKDGKDGEKEAENRDKNSEGPAAPENPDNKPAKKKSGGKSK